MIQKWHNNKEMANHIFSGSTTMIGVCITVISLFRIMNISKDTLVDEILGIDTLIFILTCLLSYLCLRNPKLRNFETLADVLFFIGITLMVVVGLIIVFSTY